MLFRSMAWTMDTEDDMNEGRTVGAIGPNRVGTIKGDTFTVLLFCFFRWAESAADTMAGFPDLGFPYAVFHDFDGPQPTWVNLKRYMYSHNETNTTDSGKGQYRHAVVSRLPKLSSVSSPIWAPGTSWLSPQRIAATR